MSALRLRLTVAYDGRSFHGFTPQPGVETIGGALLVALERALRAPVEKLFVAGRTDAGVHAWGQVVSLDVPLLRSGTQPALRSGTQPALRSGTQPALRSGTQPEGVEVDVDHVRRSLNSQLAPRIVAREVAIAPPDFHARYSALSRTYRYTVLNRPVPDPFLAATTWHVEKPLDLAALRLACDPLIGEHDFSSFCRPPRGAPSFSMVRRVIDASWRAVGDDVLRFEIEASSFCQQMVRSVVGIMVAMGAGERSAGEMAGIVRARQRSAAGRVAPPHGLCLWSVAYRA